MPGPRLIDEINRLFDELVRDPWSRPVRGLPARLPPGAPRHFEVEIPVGGPPDQFAIEINGRQLTVSVVRATRETSASGDTQVTTGSSEHLRQSFALPEGIDPTQLEARFEGGVLHIRIGIHNRHR